MYNIKKKKNVFEQNMHNIIVIYKYKLTDIN